MAKVDPQGMTPNERYAAIRAAKKVRDLDMLWDAWEARGQSREGMLHATLLARKAELGAKLTDQEQELIERGVQAKAHAATLPPITGSIRG